MSNIFGYPNYISGGSGGGTEVNAGAGLSSTTNPDGSITLAASGPFLTWYYSPEIANSRQVVGGNNVTVSTAIDGQLVISAAATGGGAPTVSSYIVGTTEASLPNSSVATEGNGITIAVTPGGAATFGVSTAITGADILTWQPGDTIFTDRRALILGSGLSADFGSNTLTLNVTGQNAGTVTSVGLSAPSWLTVGSTPVTTAGTISLTATNQSANTLLMGPSGGAAAASAFRKLLAVDLPVSAGSGITLSTDATGGLNIASSGGSGSVTSVGLALPTDTFTITNSPVTGTGTLTGSYVNQAINTFLAGASSGSPATPLWRILTRNDLPITPGSNVTFSLNSSGGLAINASVSGGGGGTVTSVDSTTPTSLFTVSGNPITLSGTLAYALTNAASSKVWAGPVSGADAAPTYRSLVAGDIPTLPFTKISGTVPVAQGGTNLTATPTNGQLPIGNGTDYTLAGITAGTGVQVANGAGAITLSATGALGGTVTSVAQSVPTALLSITGSPITTAGTLALGLTNAASGTFWAGPATGAATTPAYRSILVSDLPSTVGTVQSVGVSVPAALLTVSGSPVTTSGTIAIALATAASATVFAGPSSGAAAAGAYRALLATDLPSTTVNSTGNLSPLFTSSISAQALSFAQVNQTQALAFLSPASSTGAPTFRSIGGSDLAAGIVAGSNITITQLPGTNQMSIASTASGGSGGGGFTANTITTNATAAVSTVTFVDLASGNVTVALDTPTGNGGKEIVIKIVNNIVPPNTLTINASTVNGSARMDGQATLTSQYTYDCFSFISNNSNLWAIRV